MHVARLTPAQEVLVADDGPWARACRDVWNAALQERLEALRVARGRTMPEGWWPSRWSQDAALTQVKQVAPWVAAAPAHVLQQTLKDLDTAWAAWLYDRRAGRPRFRARKRAARNWWAPSYRFPEKATATQKRDFTQPVRTSKRWGRLHLAKLGWVTFRWDRNLPDNAVVTNVTLKRDRVGTWTVAFALEVPDVEVAHPNPGTVVGVDRGVVVLAATSDGQLLDRELLEPDAEPDGESDGDERRKLGDDLLTDGERIRLSRLERRKARQKRGSKNQARTRRQIAKLRRRQARRRTDLAHKISARLAAGYETVAVEQLDVAAMMASARGTVEQPGVNVAQKRGLNRSIASKGWGMLHSQLAYKTVRHGGRRPVAEAAYTSQTCHVCGHIDPVSRENQARWVCVACQHGCHADVNAAINVLARAVPAGQVSRTGPAAGHAVAACQALQTPVGATKQEPAGSEHAHAA